ncbi:MULTISPECIES: hypothetical protein [unclassified Caulobacter]|uniref:hypothetical protein n=1 Tax=unclassified Caulobacter TaxID=2648921 RepID=UPI000D3B2594|nr:MULTISPECIES: hypothetical protein [unclassified Caulobacter]PTS81812.1 hypothetical protein DBR21_18340 [Caulobacter sp. HMWF009]PTT06906.1 hypothetical protein DBR10_11345 [Caulobacter sp. HMWF025]PTT78463.1 hypothetical protein DBR41_23255 [Pseudomonas sp. HMWF010]
MHVVIAFTPDYGATDDLELGDAFWLVDSPANRAAAEVQRRERGTDPNSAIFRSTGAPVTPDDVLAMLGNVDLHHPDWTSITVVGVPPTSDLLGHLHSQRLATEAKAPGFVLRRNID